MPAQCLKVGQGRKIMRKFLTTLFLATMLSGCAYTRTLPPEQLVVQKVVEASGVSNEQLFEKSKVWFARTFRQSMAGWWEQNSTRTVIQYENKKDGVLIGNGAILYPHAGLTSDTFKKGWEVRFTVQVETKEGKARITFNKLTMFIPSVMCASYAYGSDTSSYEMPLDEEELARVKPLFLDLADQFGAFLRAPEEKW